MTEDRDRSSKEGFAARPENIGRVAAAASMTGAEYLPRSMTGARSTYTASASLRPPEYPAFRNTARMIARLCDALHDPERRTRLLVPTGTGNGGMTYAFFKAPKSTEDLIAGPDAIAEWAWITYG